MRWRCRYRPWMLLLSLIFWSVGVGGAASAQTGSAPLAETRTVVATGQAAIGGNGSGAARRLEARRAAIGDALRNAVATVAGVFVSARTLTSKYQLVQDTIRTNVDGYATLDTVLREETRGDTVQVTIRADVSVRPLAARLKELGLTRAWRVRVERGKSDKSDKDPDDVAALLEKPLADAGFVVVEPGAATDLTVRIQPKFTTLSETPLETALGKMTMTALRGDVVVRLLPGDGTGEVLTTLRETGEGMHINAQTARTQIVADALKALTPRLISVLLVLPARDTLPISVRVGNLSSAGDVGEIEDALWSLTGVQQVVRRDFQNKTAVWELTVLAEAASRLARELETAPDLSGFRLRVQSENRAQITARSDRK